MNEASNVPLRLLFSLLVAGVVGLSLWALGAKVGEAVVDGALFGLALLVCLSLLRSQGLFFKVAGALLLTVACFQLIGYGITFIIDGQSNLFTAWMGSITLAVIVLLNRSIISKLGLSRRRPGRLDGQ